MMVPAFLHPCYSLVSGRRLFMCRHVFHGRKFVRPRHDWKAIIFFFYEARSYEGSPLKFDFVFFLLLDERVCPSSRAKR